MPPSSPEHFVLRPMKIGVSQKRILSDYPQLEPEDFLAIYAYSAELAAGRKTSQK
jgi:uncharacterized protein (DUF433 family)